MPREYMPTSRERWESSLAILGDAVDRLAQALDGSDTTGPPAADPRQHLLSRGIATVRARACSVAAIMEVSARRSAEAGAASGQEMIDQGGLEDLTRRSDELRAQVAPLLEQAAALVRMGR